MRKHLPLSLSLCLFLLTAAPAVSKEYPTTRPYTGIAYRVETRQDPPMRLFVAEIDLTRPGMKVRVTPGGPDPDGPGEWETTLMRPTAVAAREGFDLAVNGDFYDILRKQGDAPTTAPAGEVWAAAIGPAVTDGRTWSVSREKRPCLVIRGDARASIEMVDRPPADATAVVAGNVMLLEGGKPVPQKNKARHPRTAVGIDAKGRRLVILVVDGRRPGVSIGMTYDDLAAELIRLGCDRAINLDGGGSSALVLRQSDGGYRILNQPSDGRERAVANVLGVTAPGAEKRARGRAAGRRK